ncbi:hypothetical protein V9K67_08630 [Paraflavisolibacter sp. H34]|uniref:hypothetical protein n=1 Tax=Huijunlia imazamoxiresistens TaxID=3127457 RepID=UPI003015D6A9
MARIFSIQFTCNKTQEHALVSVHETPYYTEYKISPLSNELRESLPCDKLISPSPNQFICPGAPSSIHDGVMKEIIEAISEHLHALPHS